MKKIISKKIIPSKKFISSFHNHNDLSIESNITCLNGQKAKLNFKKGKLNLTFYSRDILSQVERTKMFYSKETFKVHNKKINMIFDFQSFSKIQNPIKDPKKFDCVVRKYYNEEINSNHSFYRLMIPTSKEINPASFFESESLELDRNRYLVGIMQFNYLRKEFNIFHGGLRNKKKSFLIIDCLEKTNFTTFQKATENILLSFAFITSQYPKDEYYFLSSIEREFSNLTGIHYETQLRSLYSRFSIFPENRMLIHFGLHQKIKFPIHSFERLCEKLNSESILSRLTKLIIEGNTLSVELKAVIYSVALESITNLLSDKYHKKINPIKSKKLAEQIQNELIKVINSYKSQLDDGLETLQKKVAAINFPTNKQKLLRPFEILKIELTDYEKEIINKRNDFLHGRLPVNLDEIDGKYNLENITYTLYYLVAILVLRMIGYSGIVLYHPALNTYLQKKIVSPEILKNI